MAILKINLNDPLMKAIKAVNSIGGKSLTAEDLKKQRSSMELASKLATPNDGFSVKSFKAEGISCEWVKPDLAHNPNYIILYAHGGGYTCGGLGYARILAAKLAISTGFSVVSFEYRLAPENKYPAALDDGMVVWNHLVKQGYGAKQILLAGDSAGGNLVLCMAQKLIAEGRIGPKSILLFSPWTDMTATSSSYESCKEKDPILTKDYVEGVREAYIGKKADVADPKYSPLYGDFKDFPPTLIMVGKNEILYEDSLQLSKKIHKAGGKAILDTEKDGWHVYQQMPLPIAGRAMKRLSSFVTTVIYE